MTEEQFKTPPLWKLSFETTSREADMYGQALEEHVLAVSWYEVNEAEDHWVLEATLDKNSGVFDSGHNAPNLAYFQNLLNSAAQAQGLTAPHARIEALPETDWLEQTWKNFPPLQIGPFFVYGSHVKNEKGQVDIPQGLIGLEVNAATAFGSGDHETTSGCLDTLHDLFKEGYRYKKPLDMGCGSGILAMAIAKLWNIPVLAVDNDPESVRVTADNAKKNNCSDLINTLCNEGFDGNIVQQQGPFDLIVANILAAPLCMMASQMVENLTSREDLSGRIILSGLLLRQREEVLDAYNRAGAILVDQKIIGDWVTLLLKKG